MTHSTTPQLQTLLDKIQERVQKKRYPKGYHGPKAIGAQVDMLANMFDLSPDSAHEFIANVLPFLQLPQGAEGWFAIPSVDAVAKHHFPKVTNPNGKYCCVADLALKKIGESRDFFPYFRGKIGSRYLRQSTRTVKALDLITQKQKGDILIIPAQHGARHNQFGRSVFRARTSFAKNEFGLGVFAVSCMALTHPERYGTEDICDAVYKIHADCVGDLYNLHADGDFSSGCLMFFSHFGSLAFGGFDVFDPSELVGPVSGFLPRIPQS